MLPEHEKLLHNFEERNNILGEENFFKEDGNIIFFMGCLTGREMKDVVISLFDKLGIDITIIGGCCGYPIEKIGRKVENKIKKRLEERKIERLVMACPNGILALSEFSPLHISEFILSLNIDFKRKDKNYIYHDSAFLGRYLGIYEEPRQIIKRIGNLIEFDENKNMARQCGGEIEFRIAFPDEARKMAEYLLKEAKEKKATIVTASPHCYSHLKEYGEVVDILQLIEENMK
jgi:Fe-S oxidoreductase